MWNECYVTDDNNNNNDDEDKNNDDGICLRWREEEFDPLGRVLSMTIPPLRQHHLFFNN